jgi:hypothetical protein
VSTTTSSFPARVNQDYPVSEAVISDDGLYRYVLNRRWSDGPVMPWIMLNPSTADTQVNDATITRCCKLARRENCGGICVLNAYALRATDPVELKRHPDPVGPENDRWLAGLGELAKIACHVDGEQAFPVVVAWGANPMAAARVRRVMELLAGIPVVCLGVTRSGAPKHPLARGRERVPDDAPLVPWRMPS